MCTILDRIYRVDLGKVTIETPRRLLTSTCIVFMLMGLVYSKTVHAWTEAKVKSVHTQIEIPEDMTSANIIMTIGLKVKGGWLSSFEVNGLDPEIVLDKNDPAVILTEKNFRYRPEVKVPGGGRVQMIFADRRKKLRRGEYTLILKYISNSFFQTTKRIDSNRTQVQWTLPSWQVGIENVQIQIISPKGSRIAPQNPDQAYSIRHNYVDSQDHTVLFWRRAHLPRTVSWDIYFIIPQTHLRNEIKPKIGPTPAAESRHLSFHFSDLWLAGLLGILSLIKHWLVMYTCHTQGLKTKSLVPINSNTLRFSILASAVVLASLSFTSYRFISLALLSLIVGLGVYYNSSKIPLKLKGTWQPAVQSDLRNAGNVRFKNLFSLYSWLDATSPLGFTLLAFFYTVVILLYWQGYHDQALIWAFGALFSTPLFITSTRIDLPPPTELIVNRLAKFQKKLNQYTSSSLHIRYYLQIYKTKPKKFCKARLRLHINPHHSMDGLLSLDFVITNPGLFNAFYPQVALMFSSLKDSTADKQIDAFLGGFTTYLSQSNRNVVRLARASDLLENIQSLLEALLQNSPIPSRNESTKPVPERRAKRKKHRKKPLEFTMLTRFGH